MKRWIKGKITQFSQLYEATIQFFCAPNSTLFTILDNLSKELTGKLFGDKAYISKDLFGKLLR